MKYLPVSVTSLLITGCGSGAKTCPEVADNHAILATLTACFVALCVVWLVRGAPIRLEVKGKKDADA